MDVALPIRRPARPVLPWIVFPSVALAAWVPDVGVPLWILVTSVALGAVMAAIVTVRGLVPAAWRGPLWLPVAMVLGLAWAQATRAPLAGPALVTISAEVVTVHRASWSQRVRLRNVAGEGVASSLGAELPPGVSVLPGDRIAVAGSWERDARGEWISGVHVERRESREDGPRARAWNAIDTLGVHRELAATLLLGSGSPPERGNFRRAGLAHILAVSGLHLGIAAACAWWLLRRSRMTWSWRLLALLAVVGGYAWLTGGAPATQRAAAMVAVVTASALLGREPHRLGVLAAAVCVLTALDPLLVHAVGFQLSVCAVFGILTLGLDLVALRQRWLPLQPWPLDRRLWRGMLVVMRGASDGLAIGLGASLTIIPVIAFWFGTMTPWSPIATILATPIVTAVLWLGLPWLVLMSVWPTGPWAGLQLLMDGLLQALADLAGHAAHWPGAQIEIPAPPWWLLLLTPLLACAWPMRHSIRWRLAATVAVVAMWWVAV
jgi:ComEC/Rec2-related protein